MECQLPLIPRVASATAVNRCGKRGNQGGKMSASLLNSSEIQESSEQKLWRAVIACTVEEWVSGPLRQKRESDQLLFSDNQDYRTVCFSAGIKPENLRGRLEKIRSRQTAEEQALASRN